MAPLRRAFLLALFIASVDLSTSHLLTGSVTCLDCSSHHDLSGTAVVVVCRHGERPPVTTFANAKGHFEAEIPRASSDCSARLIGAPGQICSYKKFMASRVVEGKGPNSGYTLFNPLRFLSSCPLRAKKKTGDKAMNGREFGSGKTVDLPLPREWGLAPSSYYLPIIPIIGIP